MFPRRARRRLIWVPLPPSSQQKYGSTSIRPSTAPHNCGTRGGLLSSANLEPASWAAGRAAISRVGSTVTTRKKPTRTGEVIESTGNKSWKVRFPDGTDAVLTSAALLKGTTARQASERAERANVNTEQRFGREAFATPSKKKQRPVKHVDSSSVSSHPDTAGEDSDGVEVSLESFANTSTGSDTGSSLEYEFGDDGAEVRASTTRKAAPRGRKPKPFVARLKKLLTPGTKKKKRRPDPEDYESSEGGGADASILYEPDGVEATLLSPSSTGYFDTDSTDSDEDIPDDPDAEVDEDDVAAPSGEQFFSTAKDVEDADELRRTQRKNKFERRKRELIDEQLIITKTIAPSAAIEVGAQVETKKKDRTTKLSRRGVVVGKVSSDGGNKSTHWKVQFYRDGQPYVESLKPQQLKRADVNANSQTFRWLPVEEHIAENPVKEYSYIGFIKPPDSDLDFNHFDGNLDFKASNYPYPFAAAFEASLGDTTRFIEKMNEAVLRDNMARRGTAVKPFEKGEWMKGIGILLHAVELGEGGVEKMFPPQRRNGSAAAADGPNLPCNVRSSEVVPPSVMTKTRFQKFLEYFHYSFTGDDPTDPYNPVIGFVNDFNQRRRELVAASVTKVMDELMSAYKPRTTQAGGFPNISFVARKPEPLGVELKALIDAVTTIMLYLEIQRGKEAMNTPKYGKYSNEVGSTASF
ncbi:hypothetical protein THAOC_36784, partial [Thalassiosira oceanica]